LSELENKTVKHKRYGKKYEGLREDETDGKDQMKGSDTTLNSKFSWDPKHGNNWST
jgi:hypothetical protein